ncbi:hypothetical protein LJR220_003397 [Bradyrhizobium sp. LjRoot220]|uniref:hypothetical protein n=1 Tax=Bradyrhizobium sp. LjRoot220 TaxID=3342284 RepID=UPI003ECCCA4B
MTNQAERIREQHRGARRAEPASTSRLAALDTFGLRYVRIDDFNVIVDGEYLLNLAMSYWRANDGSAHGYLVSTLDAEIRRQGKPVAGRDSVAAGDRIASTTGREVAAVAESAAGPQHQALPKVNPWP